MTKTYGYVLRFVLAVALCRILFAQSVPENATVSGTGVLHSLPRQVSVETRAKLWRALAEYKEAKPIYDRVLANLQVAQSAAAKECGEGYNLQTDESGEPACIAKPPEKPAAEKKK